MLTALVLAGVVVAASADARVPGRPEADAVQSRPAPDGPFSTLFAPGQPGAEPGRPVVQVPAAPRVHLGVLQRPGFAEPAPVAPDTPRRKIVCGTTLLIVGSEPDPRMVRPKPDAGVTYTMRRYPPPACGKEK